MTVRPPSPHPTRRNLLSLETMKESTGWMMFAVEMLILFKVFINGRSLMTMYPFSVP